AWYFLRTAAAAGGAGALCALLRSWLEPRFPWTTLAGSAAQGMVLVLVFVPVFLLLAAWLRLAGWSDLRAAFPVRAK
ncbi:MAG TPA: hypothetical protein VNN17_05005, partial [Terriglobia bacterium]|nr:hypothetical protein [Terriglobia bacterium]